MSVDGNRGPTIELWRTIASSLIVHLSSFSYALVEEVKICLYNFEARSESVGYMNLVDWNGGVDYWTGLLECHAHKCTIWSNIHGYKFDF